MLHLRCRPSASMPPSRILRCRFIISTTHSTMLKLAPIFLRPPTKRNLSTSSALAATVARPERPTVLPKNWPAPPSQLTAGRQFLRDVAYSDTPVLLLPDWDADGISAGTILYRTLRLLHKPPRQIHVHFCSAAAPLYSDERQEIMEELIREKEITHAIIVDQGSHPGPRLLSVKTLLVDHHACNSFPEDTTVVSACHSPPIATSSLLAYHLTLPLIPTALTPREEYPANIPIDTTWLALVGLYSDLGPSSAATFSIDAVPPVKPHRKVHLTKIATLLNAPRRSPHQEMSTAWDLVALCPLPNNIYSGKYRSDCIKVCNNAKNWWGNELGIQSHTAPRWSSDARLAVIEVESEWNVHGVLAQRWAASFGRKGSGGKTEVVLCVNRGWGKEGMVSFSGRAVKRGVEGEGEGEVEGEGKEKEGTDVMALLREYAKLDDEVWKGVEEDWVQGRHVQAAGGRLPEELWRMFAERCLKLPPPLPRKEPEVKDSDLDKVMKTKRMKTKKGLKILTVKTKKTKAEAAVEEEERKRKIKAKKQAKKQERMDRSEKREGTTTRPARWQVQEQREE